MSPARVLEPFHWYPRLMCGANVPYVRRPGGEWLDGRRASAEQVVFVAGRQAQVDPESDPVLRRLLDRLLHANRDVANSAGVAERRVDPAIADAVVYRTKEVNLRDGRADPANGRIGCDDDVGRDVRHGDRYVQIVRDAVGDERSRTTDLGVDRVDCRNDVLTPATQLGVVVREYRRHRLQVYVLDRIERETLIGETDRHTARADGVRAFGEDGTEARSRTREHAEPRVELIGEPRGRSGQWQRDDLTGQRGAELGELALEAAVEVRSNARRRRRAMRGCSRRVRPGHTAR